MIGPLVLSPVPPVGAPGGRGGGTALLIPPGLLSPATGGFGAVAQGALVGSQLTGFDGPLSNRCGIPSLGAAAGPGIPAGLGGVERTD